MGVRVIKVLIPLDKLAGTCYSLDISGKLVLLSYSRKHNNTRSLVIPVPGLRVGN